MSNDPLSRRKLVLLATLFEGGLGVLAAALGWLAGRMPFQSLHWDAFDIFWGVAATIPMLLLFLICVRFPVGPLRRIEEFCDEVVKPLFHKCSTVEIGCISLLAGLGEELLFRGVLQEIFRDWFGFWAAIVAVNVVFGLLHMITPAYAVMAALLGVYLSGLMIWRENNLLVVIVAHGLYDFVAILYLVRGWRPGTTIQQDLP